MAADGFKKKNSKPRALSSGLVTVRDITMHFKRTAGQLTVGGAELGEQKEVHDTRVVLNDLKPDGIFVFTSRPMQGGQPVSLTLEHPRKFFVSGRVVSCQEITLNAGIMSEHAFNYRIEIAFEFKDDAEKAAVKEYCGFLGRNYLGRAA